MDTIITPEEFDTAVSTNERLVVQFGGDFCKPCKGLKPHMTGFVTAYPSVKIVYVDVTDGEELYERENELHAIKGLPCTRLYHHGKLVDGAQVVGGNHAAIENNIRVLSKMN